MTTSEQLARAKREIVPGIDLDSTDLLLSTTKSVRRRLDLERPVDPAIIEECLSVALNAPNAENRQNWRWLVITDPAKKELLAKYYRLAWLAHNRAGNLRRRSRYRDTRGSQRTHESAGWLATNLARVPVLVIPCVLGRPLGASEIGALETEWQSGDPPGEIRTRADLVSNATYYGSIYPAIWSFCLALRSRGLGTTITTMHLPFHEFVAEEIGIPRQATQLGLLPVAYTVGTTFSPPERSPIGEVVFWNHWTSPRQPDAPYSRHFAVGEDSP